MVEPGTKGEDWGLLLRDSKSGCLELELPREITATKWDVILVDAPKGCQPSLPGRMKSIFMASKLARGNQHVDVFVHDCERQIEDVYTKHVLCPENLVCEVERLRHYRIRLGNRYKYQKMS